jgi:hypothetical protein
MACSGSSPTAPPAPTATSITINSGAGHLFLGNSETFTATVTLSNGTTQALTGGAWSSDATPVATVVAGTGAVTAVSSGEVTIIVDAQGVRGTKRMRVLPSYQGIWFGTYTVNTCTQTGDFATADLCGDTFVLGTSLFAAINFFTQNGAALTAQTVLGSLYSDNLTATVSANGSLSFQVAATVPGTTVRITQAWAVDITQPGRLTGTLTQTWTDPTLTGQTVVATTLSNFTPTGQAMAQRGAVGRSYNSLREAANALLRGGTR